MTSKAPKSPNTGVEYREVPALAKDFISQVDLAASALHGLGGALESGHFDNEDGKSIELGLCSAVNMVSEYLDGLSAEMRKHSHVYIPASPKE